MSKDNSQNTGSSTKKQSKINIGVIVFFVIFVYLVLQFVTSLVRPHYSYDTVDAGQLTESDIFHAFIIREEQTISTNQSGYVNYFVSDGARTAKNGNICIIDGNNSSNSTESSSITISDSDYDDIREIISNYSSNYSDEFYSDIYSLNFLLTNAINNIVTTNNIKNLSSLAGKSNYSVVKAGTSGLVSYTVDGYEGTTPDSFTPDLLNTATEDKTQISAGSYVKSGSPVCRLITNDTWELVFKPDFEQMEKFEQLEKETDERNQKNGTNNSPSIWIRFVKDNIKAKCKFEITVKDSVSYITLTLSEYIVRYCNDRFEDIEIVWSDYSGLKIPKSSLIKENFYKISSDYVTTDSSGQRLFYIMTSEGPTLKSLTNYEYIEYGEEDKDGNIPLIYYYLIKCDSVDEGTRIKSTESDEYLTLDSSMETFEADCVYNVNQGYAELCPVIVLYEYGDYCIIRKENSKYISMYDRILLNGNSVHENQIIY